MQAAIGWMYAGFMVIILGFIILAAAVGGYANDVKAALNPNGRKLATEYYVERMVDATKKVEKNKPDGYCYMPTFEAGHLWIGREKIRVDCNKVDENQDQVKIRWLWYDSPYVVDSRFKEKWIPKKDFHKYHTLKEVSEILNKKKK